MKFPALIRIVLLSFTYSITSYADEPRPGYAVDGGIYLYNEPVEADYTNDWVAFPLMEPRKFPTTGQADATIRGEGKSVDFIGNISINCENGKHSWQSGGNFIDFLTSSEAVDEVVPEIVIRKTINLLCKRA